MSLINWTIPTAKFSWTDITNPTAEELKLISETHNLNEYNLKDCMEPDHLPKHEDLGDFQFMITRYLNQEPGLAAHTIQGLSNKIAIFYNDAALITIHRVPFEFIERIKVKYYDAHICNNTNEMVIKIIWNVLHSFDAPVLQLANEVDQIENKIFLKVLNPSMLEDLYLIKRRISVRSKLLTLTGEVIQAIKVKSKDASMHQDLKELRIKLMLLNDQTHENVTNLLNIYLSLSAQKTNDVMKVLTIFSVFFMPLTFIVGVYGMNFDFMPELRYKWSYPILLVSMFMFSAIIYWWFKRKKWL